MRALVLHAPAPVEEAPLRWEERDSPEPGEGEVRLVVRACAVCRTDLHIVEGEVAPARLPLVPGHQVVGIVEAVGPKVGRWRGGERVGLPWLYSTCGTCSFCRRGRENLCDSARFTGLHADGGYAEQVIAPADFVHPLPPDFPDEQAAPLLCAGIIGYRALRLSQVQPGERLGLYGFGASAHLVIQVARFWGCEVFVFTRTPAHREHALRLGAAWAGEAQEQVPAPLDAAIIFAPAGDLVPWALRAVRKGGVVALAGIHMSPLPAMDYGLLYGERVLRSVANSTRQDAQELLELATLVPLHTDVEVFPLEKANEALLRLKQSRITGAAVLVPS